MFNIIMEYLPEDDEVHVATRTTSVMNHQFKRAVNAEDVRAFQQLVRRVPIAEPVARYAVNLARARSMCAKSFFATTRQPLVSLSSR